MKAVRSVPLTSFGWSLAGVLLLALSLPPVGFFPLAWVGLIPILSRWAMRKPSVQSVNELYALFLTLAACSGFWLVLHPDMGTAIKGWFGLLLVPIPLVASFAISAIVKERFGLVAGLVSLVGLVLTGEYLLLHMPNGVPWLLLAHTQVEASPFTPIASFGGVGMLSAWILALNIAGFYAVSPFSAPNAVGERGAAAAVFVALLVFPAATAGIAVNQEGAPAGYARLGLVQPGANPYAWDRLGPQEKVTRMAALSDDLVARWRAPVSTDTASGQPASARGQRPAGQSQGVLIWPYGAIPAIQDTVGEQRLTDRLEWWSERRGVALLAGTFWSTAKKVQATPPAGAVLVGAGLPVQRYQQMRRVAIADRPGQAGSSRTLLSTGGVRLGVLIGYESLYGDHVRKFVEKGADLLVVLPQSGGWGRAGGTAEHLHLTRLRAVETQRSIVIASVSGPSALVHPDGKVELLAGWGQEKTIPLDVPTFRTQTLYTRQGDWIGRTAGFFVLLYHLALALAARFLPRSQTAPRKRPAHTAHA